MTTYLTLAYYDPNKEIYEASDASNLGLETLHKEKYGQ